MINIKDYHNILKKYDITENEGHLLLKEDVKNKKQIIRDLFLSLGDLRAENPNFRLQKTTRCSFPNCVSPQCHNFILKSAIVNSALSTEDIEEIAKEMDLDEIEQLGCKEYLKKYNESLPEFLKISMGDFKTIYTYMKGLRW